jgi:hypothetical protein
MFQDKGPAWWTALVLLGAGSAAAAGWIDLNPPSTARLTRIAAAGSTLLAGSDSGLMYRSSDGGANWVRGAGTKGLPVHALLVDGLNAYAARPDFYYPLADCFSQCMPMRYGTDLIVSRDGGATWKSDSLRGVQSLARSRDGSIWALGWLFVHHLPAGNTEWIREPFRFATGSDVFPSGSRKNSQGLAVREPYLLAVLENRLFAAGIQHAGDSVTFERLGDDSTFALVGDSTQTLVANQGGLWKITPTNPKPQLVKVNAARFAWLSLAGGVLLGAEKGGPALRSLDGGITWKPIGAADAEPATSAAVMGPDAFVIAPDGEIVASRDSGAWQGAMAGIRETRSQPLLVAGGRIYANTWQGLRSVPAGGGTWDSLPGIPAGTNLTMMAATQGWLWAAGDGLWRGRRGSADAWERVMDIPVYALAAEGKRAIAAIDRPFGTGSFSHALLICDEGEPCRETAEGQLGYTALTGFPWPIYPRLQALVVHGDTVMAYDRIIYRSIDGGNTWDSANILTTEGGAGGRPYHLYNMIWSGTGLLARMFGGENSYPCLYRSSDLGTTWDRLALTGIPINPYSPLTAGGRYYSSFDSIIYVSPDALTWSPLSRPVGTRVFAMQADADWLAASGNDETVWSLKLEAPLVGTRRSGKAVRAALAPPPGAGLFLDRAGRLRQADGRMPPR